MIDPAHILALEVILDIDLYIEASNEDCTYILKEIKAKV